MVKAMTDGPDRVRKGQRSEAAGPLESLASEALRVLDILRSELTVSQAVKLAAKITGANKNQLYEAANSRGDQ